jgi:hypothetical protein
MMMMMMMMMMIGVVMMMLLMMMLMIEIVAGAISVKYFGSSPKHTKVQHSYSTYTLLSSEML